MSRPIRLVIADDHHLIRCAMAEVLAAHQDLELVGEADDGRGAVELAGRVRPDVVLMDYSMPRMNGPEATRLIKSSYPDMSVIGFSMHESDIVAAAMRAAGAVTHLSKGCELPTLISAIRRAARPPTDADAAQSMPDRRDHESRIDTTSVEPPEGRAAPRKSGSSLRSTRRPTGPSRLDQEH